MIRFLLAMLAMAFVFSPNLCLALEPFTAKDIDPANKYDFQNLDKLQKLADEGDVLAKTAVSEINYINAQKLAKKNNKRVSGPECETALRLIKEITELKPDETDVETLQAQALLWTDLGYMYDKNHCVAQNKWKALECFKKAAEIGYVEAMINAAHCYEYDYDGKLGSQNQYLAREWYEKAAAAGSARAKYMLGNSYENPRFRGIENIKKAREWYEFAAKDGYPEAQFKIGMMYQNGKGVRQDTGKALSWLEKAANQKHLRSRYEMGMIYYKGEGIDKDIHKAKELFGEACDGGYESACSKYAAINKGEY